MSQYYEVDPQYYDMDPTRAFQGQAIPGGDIPGEAWLDDFIHGDNSPAPPESTPSNPAGSQPRRTLSTEPVSPDPDEQHFSPPPAPNVSAAPAVASDSKDWGWKKWLTQPVTSTTVRLKLRGMERSERRAAMWQTYKESPTWKNRARLIGDFVVHGSVLFLTYKALGSAAQGLELAGIDLPSVGDLAPHHQPTGAIHTPGPEVSTKPSPDVTPSTGKSAAATTSPSITAKPSQSPPVSPSPNSSPSSAASQHTSPTPKPSASTLSPSPSTAVPGAKPSTPASGFGTGAGAGAETGGGNTPKITGETIQVPTELASRSAALGAYEWDEDRKLWKGTPWFQVDQYARELGIRDQLDTKEFRDIVDQALVNNKIGGEGASHAERWDAAENLGNGKVIKLDIDLFKGKTEKPLVVTSSTGGAEIPAADRFKEDNGVNNTITVDGTKIVVQNDGDLVIDGKEIDTSVAKGSTLKSYLAHLNSQLDPSKRISDVNLQMLEARLKATPETANALGLDAKNPNAPMAFYGNMPPTNADIFKFAYMASLPAVDAGGVSPSALTPPSITPTPPAHQTNSARNPLDALQLNRTQEEIGTAIAISGFLALETMATVLNARDKAGKKYAAKKALRQPQPVIRTLNPGDQI